jgi:hypothetical protein
MLQKTCTSNVLSPVTRATRINAGCIQTSLPRTTNRQCLQGQCVLMKKTALLGALHLTRTTQRTAQRKSLVLAQSGTAAVNAAAAGEGDNKGSGNG